MNKDELIRLIYAKVNELTPNGNLTLKNAAEVYEALISGIKQSLYDGEEVRLPSFGRFYVNHSGPRTIPHPKVTGQTMEIGPSRQIRFKVFPTAKAELNGKV